MRKLILKMDVANEDSSSSFSECSDFDDCVLDVYGGEPEYSKAELAAMKFDDDDEESTSEDLDCSRLKNSH